MLGPPCDSPGSQDQRTVSQPEPRLRCGQLGADRHAAPRLAGGPFRWVLTGPSRCRCVATVCFLRPAGFKQPSRSFLNLNCSLTAPLST